MHILINLFPLLRNQYDSIGRMLDTDDDGTCNEK